MFVFALTIVAAKMNVVLFATGTPAPLGLGGRMR